MCNRVGEREGSSAPPQVAARSIPMAGLGRAAAHTAACQPGLPKGSTRERSEIGEGQIRVTPNWHRSTPGRTRRVCLGTLHLFRGATKSSVWSSRPKQMTQWLMTFARHLSQEPRVRLVWCLGFCHHRCCLGQRCFVKRERCNVRKTKIRVAVEGEPKRLGRCTAEWGRCGCVGCQRSVGSNRI